MIVLKKESNITSGAYKGCTVEEAFKKGGKKAIFKILTDGYSIDDDFLNSIGIKRTVRNVTFTNEFVEHEKDNKVYKKDTMKADRIISELQTIVNIGENKTDYFDD